SDRDDRLREKVDRQSLVVRTMPTAAPVERRRRGACGDDAEDQSREDVRHVELSCVVAVSEDHAWSEHGDGQPAQVVRLAQQHFTCPLADSVAVGVTLADGADRYGLTNVGNL